MSRQPLAFIRVAALSAALLAGLAQAQAPMQPPPADAAPAAEPAARNQKIENIHVEDQGASVDEVRFGGRTQSITVQPKARVPSYEVLPDDSARARPGPGSQESGSNGNGARVWNVMKF